MKPDFNSFDVKSIEWMCKLTILWWLEKYEPADWRINGNYLFIHIDEEKEWYFDMTAVGTSIEEQRTRSSAGFAIGDCEFYWLYRFDAHGVPDAFHESRWNQKEFKRLIYDLEKEGELTAFYEALHFALKDWRMPIPIYDGVYFHSLAPGYERGKKY